MSEEEEKKPAKEEEILGFKISNLGAMLGAGALLGVLALGFHVLKPQLPNLQPQQPQPQLTQQHLTPEQQQQQIQQQQAAQAQAQQQQEQQQQQQQAVQYGYATEQDPMSGKMVRQRVREIESEEDHDRFTSISV